MHQGFIDRRRTQHRRNKQVVSHCFFAYARMSISLKLKGSKKKHKTDHAKPENIEYVSEISTETSIKRDRDKWSEEQSSKHNWHLNRNMSLDETLRGLPSPPTLDDYKKCTINEFANKYRALLTCDSDPPSKRHR